MRSTVEFASRASDWLGFWGLTDPQRIIFTANGTESLNLAIHGLLRPGDHVVTSVVDHNSVLRPLRFLVEQRGIEVDRVACDRSGVVDPEAIQTGPPPPHATDRAGSCLECHRRPAADRRCGPNRGRSRSLLSGGRRAIARSPSPRCPADRRRPAGSSRPQGAVGTFRAGHALRGPGNRGAFAASATRRHRHAER